MKKKHSQMFFSPILISILAIITPSIFFLILLMNFSLKNSISMAEKVNKHMLDQIRDQIESVFEEMEMVSLSFIMNPSVNSIFRILGSGESLDYSRVYEIQKQLPRYDLSNSYIRGVDIIYKANNLILNPSGSIIDFYGSLGQKIFPDQDNIQYDKQLWGEKYHNQILSTEGGVWFLNTFPLESQTPAALILIELNKFSFYDLLSFFDIGEDGQIGIYSDGREILRYPENRQVTGRGRLLTNTLSSSDKSWKIQYAVPYTHILDSVRSIRRIQVGITLISIVTTMILGFILVKWNSKPLLRLIGKLSSDSDFAHLDGINKYELINSRVDSVLEERKNLKNQIQLQKKILQHSYIGNLIRGDFGDTEESQELARIAGVTSSMFPMAVFITKPVKPLERGLDSFVSQNEIGMAIIRFTREIFNYSVTNYPLERGDLLTLLSVPAEKDPRHFLEFQLIPYLKDNGFRSISVFYGGIVDDAEGIHNAAADAELMLLASSAGQVGFFDTVPSIQKIETFIYPLEWEVKLSTFIRAGNRERVLKLLNEIERVNFVENHFSIYSIHQLLGQLAGTLARCMNGIFHPYPETTDPHAVFLEIKDRFLSITARNARQRENEDDILKDRISGYLMKHYQNPGFTIHHLAEYTGLSETVFYNTFRRLFGVTLASYLEDLRIRKGTELLESGMKISDVAYQSGYANSQTFRRVFKKITGVTPSDFARSG